MHELRETKREHLHELKENAPASKRHNWMRLFQEDVECDILKKIEYTRSEAMEMRTVQPKWDLIVPTFAYLPHTCEYVIAISRYQSVLTGSFSTKRHHGLCLLL